MEKLTEKQFIEKYIYPTFSHQEKEMYLLGSCYPDEDYIKETANNLNIIIK
jgi:hypothetical protein